MAKFTRRLIIVPDAEIGPDCIDSVQQKDASGTSGRAAVTVDVEATPVVKEPERGSRYRQYQREQDGELDALGVPAVGTAVAVPVKKFTDDTIKIMDKRYTDSGTSFSDLPGLTAHGEGDILPVLSGTPEDEGRFNLLVSSPGSEGSARFSYNVAEESRAVHLYESGDNPEDHTYSTEMMPGDAQFRGSPLVFHKAPDVLASSDGSVLSTSDIANPDSPNITIPVNNGQSYVGGDGGKYFCRPKLLPLSDGRLMATHIRSNRPVQDWTLYGPKAGGAVENDPFIQFASGNDAKWSEKTLIDPSRTLFFASRDGVDPGSTDDAIFFLDSVQFSDTKEIVMVAGTSTVHHLDYNVYETGDYPPLSESDTDPGGTIRLSDVGGGAYAESRGLTVVSSMDGGKTFQRKSILSLKTASHGPGSKNQSSDVPGIDESDIGVILGGACELTGSGRLLVTLCTSENVYLLSSDDRGVTFRASIIKKLSVDPKLSEVKGYLDTPPPDGEALDGDLYIPKRYDYEVLGIIDGSDLSNRADGLYIVTSDEPDPAAPANPLVNRSNSIFEKSTDPATGDPVVSNIESAAEGATAYASGIPDPAGGYLYTPRSLIFDSQAGTWLEWDARGEWNAKTDEPILAFKAETGSWVEHKDTFGTTKRDGFIVKIESGDPFAGKTVVRVQPSAGSRSPYYEEVESDGVISSLRCRDTITHAGMCLTSDGDVCISVSYTDFTSLVDCPEYISASAAFQTFGRSIYNAGYNSKNLETVNSDVAYRDFFINPKINYAARKTSVFITRNGDSAKESNAWSYQSSDRNITKVSGSAANDAGVDLEYSTSITGSPSDGLSDGSAFGPSALESTVVVRPDGYPQVYSAAHNWAPPEFIGAHNDLYLNGNSIPAPNPLFSYKENVRNFGVMNVLASKTFSKRKPSSSFSSIDVFSNEYVDQINSSCSSSDTRASARDEQYDVVDNQVSFGEDGTLPNIQITGLDFRRTSSANPVHGIGSYYVPNGFIHPGAFIFRSLSGITYTGSFSWSKWPNRLNTDSPVDEGQGSQGQIGITPQDVVTSQLPAGTPQVIVYAAFEDVALSASGQLAFKQRHGFEFKIGTRFYGQQPLNGKGQIYTYEGGPRTMASSYKRDDIDNFDNGNTPAVIRVSLESRIAQFDAVSNSFVTTGDLRESVRALQNNVNSSASSSLSRYFAGLTGGVSGVDAVQWRGQTIVMTAQTQQFNGRSYSHSDPTGQRFRNSLGSPSNLGQDFSSIVVYRSSGWQPIRENLGRIDNAWGFGMGSDWANMLAMYKQTPFYKLSVGNANFPDRTSSLDVEYGGSQSGENAKPRGFRLMAGRMYQATIDGQRDPGRSGWNVESSAAASAKGDSQIYLINASMPKTIEPHGTANLSFSDIVSQGGGMTMWRRDAGGSAVYLGAAENNQSNKDMGFLPFSEGRQCSPISEGMAKSNHGSPLTGGFRAVFAPIVSSSFTERFHPKDFKVFFSLLLTNKEWLPDSDPDSSSNPPSEMSAGIIVSLGYNPLTKKLYFQAFSGHDLYSSSSVVPIGKPIEHEIKDHSDGVEYFELLAGFDEAFAPANTVNTSPSNPYPRDCSFHAFIRKWDRSSDPDFEKSYDCLVNYQTLNPTAPSSTSPFQGPKGSTSVVEFNKEHFLIGNIGAGISGQLGVAEKEAGIVVKSAALHRPGSQILGSSAVPANVLKTAISQNFGSGIYDVRAFGTALTVRDTANVQQSNLNAGGGNYVLQGDIRTSFGGGIDPRSIVIDNEGGNSYYGPPMFKVSSGSKVLASNDSGVVSPTRTQLCLPVKSWIRDGIYAEWRGNAQESASFSASSSYMFSAENIFDGPVSRPWKTGDGKESSALVQRTQNYQSALGMERRSKVGGRVIEDIEIILDAWGESGNASSGDYIDDVFNGIATSKQFSPNGVAVFGKNFPAFELAFSNDKTKFDSTATPADSFRISFGLPGDGRVNSTSANWFDYEPDKYIHLWAWTSESFNVGNVYSSPIVGGGKDKFPYFGDFTFTYRKNIGDETVTSISNIYAKNREQESLTPWMPHQFKSEKNGPSFYMQVISEGNAGSGDQASRFIFKIKDNTEDTIILDDNPLRVLSQYSYGESDQSPFVGEYRSWKSVSIFSDRMASEIVYSMVRDSSKRIGPDGFITQQTPSLPGSGFRYARITIKGCTRFGSEKSQKMGRMVMGRLLDLSGPDFEWGWSRTEQSGVNLNTTKGGQRFAKKNHSPRRVFNVSHHPLEPKVDNPNTGSGQQSNYFESTRRGFGSSFGPGWEQEKRKWDEVVYLLRSLGPGLEQAALVFEGDSALASKQPGTDNYSRTQVPTDPTSLCLVRLTGYGEMRHEGYVGRDIRVPQGSQSDAINSNESFGSTVCRPRPIIKVSSIQFEEEF